MFIPQILYAFSDVICFVTQQANIAEDIVERLIKWADKVHLKSLNQVALPPRSHCRKPETYQLLGREVSVERDARQDAGLEIDRF